MHYTLLCNRVWERMHMPHVPPVHRGHCLTAARLCYRVRVLGQRNVRSKRVSLATHENQTKVAKRDEAMERDSQSGEPIYEQLSPRKRPLPRILFGSEVSARQRTCGTSDHGASANAAVYCDTTRATHERREGPRMFSVCPSLACVGDPRLPRLKSTDFKSYRVCLSGTCHVLHVPALATLARATTVY